MSEILARIRVRETHGIRRFLYPLSAKLTLVVFSSLAYGGLDTSLWSLSFEDGQAVPCQIEHEGHGLFSINFAVSLAPYESLAVILMQNGQQGVLDDPLFVTATANNDRPDLGPFVSTQQRFSLGFAYGKIHWVNYDGKQHLKEPSRTELNGQELAVCDSVFPLGGETMAATTGGSLCLETQRGIRWAYPLLEITACKSWVMASYSVSKPQSNDEIVFTLPLAITSPTLTCDFGVGGYVFGKLDEKATEIVWRTEFGDAPHARWTVATGGRMDYVGEVATAAEFLPQRWFHLIDSDKALAVAITKVPPDCREMTVRLTHKGDVSVAFRLGATVADHPADYADFGLCYHFLNDVPAIAAATNPQSILLPPVVEVLPV